jgi:integrase
MEAESFVELAQKLILLASATDEQEKACLKKEITAFTGERCNEETGFLKFTEKEISKMPKTFRKEFRTQGCTAHIRKRTDGRYVCSYEIRYRRNGYNISVSAKTVEQAKIRFIEALKTTDPQTSTKENGTPKTFNEFSLYYFENFRKRKVTERTMKEDLWRYKKYLLPVFGSTPIKSITPLQCQNLIDGIVKDGKEKTATEIFSMLNVIFKMAIRHDIITRNPLDIVFIKKHERKHGIALTRDEEKTLLQAVAGTPYQIMFAVALYTGLRPNEYETARINENFIIAKNSKRKNGKIEYKRIPITPMLRPYLDNVTELKFYKPEQMRNKMKPILPEHKIYDLRTTFYTRCQECGISEVAIKLFVGHSLGGLADTYTDISNEYLLKEGEKLNY